MMAAKDSSTGVVRKLVANPINQPHQPGKNSRIAIRLTGTKIDRAVIGAKIKLTLTDATSK